MPSRKPKPTLAPPLNRRSSDRQIDAWCERATALERDILQKLEATKQLMTAHAAEDLRQMEAVRIELGASKALITRVSTDLADLLLLARIGRGTMTAAKSLRKLIIWFGSAAAALALLWAAIMYLLGRGPLPPMGH